MNSDNRIGPACGRPSTSGDSRKRKRPDFEDVLSKEGPLTEPPIDNEYEHLDDDDDDPNDEYKGPFFNLKRADQRQILEAQEGATIRQYGDIKVTPFNLEEELEEGEFDKAGNFVFKKKGNPDSDEEENDNWAESVNWAEVEKKEQQQQQQQNEDVELRDASEVGAKPVIKLDKIGAYKSMMRLMKPNEIVKKTIQRLGSEVPKRKPLNKNAKQRPEVGQSQSGPSANADEARRKLDLMIELAHDRLNDGDIDIYQKSYDDLEDAIN